MMMAEMMLPFAAVMIWSSLRLRLGVRVAESE
jgi:hypothetical protein